MTRRAYSGLILAVIAIVLAAVLVPAAIGRHDGDPRPGITDHGPIPDGPGIAQLVRVDRTVTPPHPVEPGQVARSEQDFSFALLSTLARSGTNTTVSPASLAIALGMLQLGARGRTASEIATVLHTAGISAATQGDGWRAITASWARAARGGGLTLETANSLWQQTGMTIPRPYLAAIAEYFDTGVWQTDFRNRLPAALAAMNRWTAQHTHGRITKLFDDGMLDSSTRLVLANAVYFKAAWAQPFEAAETSGGTFTRSDASTVVARFMHAAMNLRSVVTPDYSAVELPYLGGRFSALAIMPTSTSLSSYTSAFTGRKLRSIVAGMRAQQVQLALPSFETSSVLDLNGALQKLGMRTAFTDHADLSGIGRDLYVQQAIQRTYLKVAEKGTEAAAVTGIGVAGSAAVAQPRAISFDHPFLFLIRDTVTGTLLFTSAIENPQS